MANAYSHIGLCVTDLERSRRFYEEVFGFRPAFEFRTEGPETPQLLRLEAPLTLDAVYLWLDGLRRLWSFGAELEGRPEPEHLLVEPA